MEVDALAQSYISPKNVDQIIDTDLFIKTVNVKVYTSPCMESENCLLKLAFAQSAWAVEYTDCISTEG